MISDGGFSGVLKFGDAGTPESLIANQYFLKINLLWSEMITAIFLQRDIEDDFKYDELEAKYKVSKMKTVVGIELLQEAKYNLLIFIFSLFHVSFQCICENIFID